MARQRIERYNALFDVEGTGASRDLTIEITCIKKGGKWTKDGVTCGMGLPHHYQRMREILWPKLDDHRWHRLTRDNILANKVTVLMGPGSSGKTHAPAWIYLCEYWCFPEETCVLVSSTDIRGLRLRVWGEINLLWDAAKEKFPWLAGNLIDSKLAICTDDLEEDKVRDLRRGIIGIPCIQNGKFVGLGKYCFPAGTLVDTPFGKKCIETIKPGELVMSAIGARKVIATANHHAPQLVRLHLSNGHKIECTPEHRFLTHLGWVNAIDIHSHHKILSSDETMFLMREATSQTREKILLSAMSEKKLGEVMCPMRSPIHSFGTESSVLQSILRREMEMESTGDGEEYGGGPGFGDHWQENKPVHFEKQKGSASPEAKYEGDFEANGEDSETLQRNRRRSQTHQSRRSFKAVVSQSDLQPPDTNREKFTLGRSVRLLHRLCMAGYKIGRGNRRLLSQTTRSEMAGREKRPVFERTRVDRVEVLQSKSDAGNGDGGDGYHVFNLEVEGHPSYSVENCVVHNCGIKQKRMRLIADEAQFMSGSFLSAFANLDKNEDFRACILGNPNDPLDQLGKAAEPLDGWTTHMEPTKTEVWKTRFMSGTCVNLIGTDSPNFDFPANEPTRYKYLISREKIANTLSFFPKDSIEYYSQCIGAMKVGVLARRVLTRDICKQFGALDDVLWKGTVITKIYGLDAAYGGDRCVGGHIEYGQDNNGKVVINIHPPEIIPIRVGGDKTAEDQIAEHIRIYCEREGIPPENMFHDSTGRGSLGTSLARIWSAQTNPVEFGGNPTERPVCNDLYIKDPKTGERRLLKCSEYYRKFITEMWFSVRYAVEAGQIRNLPEDVMEEFCLRQWRHWMNKKEIEPKTGTPGNPGMKERTGRSPDLADWLATCVEGARRRGFQIAKLANDENESRSLEWLDDLRRKSNDLRARHQLTHIH